MTTTFHLKPYSHALAKIGATIRIELSNGAHGYRKITEVDDWYVTSNGDVFDPATGEAVAISRWHSGTARITGIAETC